MDYEKKYKDALERAQKELQTCGSIDCDAAKQIFRFFPELRKSEDERIRKEIIQYLQRTSAGYCNADYNYKEWISWLENQGDTNETINRDEFAQGVLRGAAINLITWIDYNTAKGNMCLSNMECKVIEDALVSGDWDKIYAYIKRKLEKQVEQKPTIEMKSPEESLGIDSDTYNKIVDECIYGEQKSAWSEEDISNIDHLLNALCGVIELKQFQIDKLIKWLKSLKERLKGE